MGKGNTFVRSGFGVALVGRGEGWFICLVLSSWCLVVVVLLFLAVSLVCLRLVIVVFPYHTHLLFLVILYLIVSIHDLCPVFLICILVIL